MGVFAALYDSQKIICHQNPPKDVLSQFFFDPRHPETSSARSFVLFPTCFKIWMLPLAATFPALSLAFILWDLTLTQIWISYHLRELLFLLQIFYFCWSKTFLFYWKVLKASLWQRFVASQIAQSRPRFLFVACLAFAVAYTYLQSSKGFWFWSVSALRGITAVLSQTSKTIGVSCLFERFGQVNVQTFHCL